MIKNPSIVFSSEVLCGTTDFQWRQPFSELAAALVPIRDSSTDHNLSKVDTGAVLVTGIVAYPEDVVVPAKAWVAGVTSARQNQQRLHRSPTLRA